MTMRYDFYATHEECASIAAARFSEQRWRWKGKGVPTKEMIVQRLQELAQIGSNHVEAGRLIYRDGRFGVQNLDLPYPWERRNQVKPGEM